MDQRPCAAIGPIARMAVVAALALVISVMAGPAMARSHHHHRAVSHSHHHHRATAAEIAAWDKLSATYPSKDAALIIDGETGKVLYARNADAIRHPASLTKLMTLYLLFEQLRSGHMSMSTKLPVSRHAAAQSPTKLYLKPGTSIPVDTAIRAVVVKSANDVAVAIAEAIGGTESHFAQMMTAKARAFGMTQTFYHNASGLPDNLQVTSARDLGVIARHLAYDFPQYFHYFGLTSFVYNGRVYKGHDNLLGTYDGADGMKTGYTNGSGFNLVSSVVRNGVHIIGVVMGGRSAHKRDMEMVRLLDNTFSRIHQNPTLVAHGNIPWETLAANTHGPAVVASLGLPSVSVSPTARPSPAPNDRPGMLRITANGEIDEDTAESQPDPDDAEDDDASDANVVAPQARPQPAIGKPVVTASYDPPTAPAVPDARPAQQPQQPQQQQASGGPALRVTPAVPDATEATSAKSTGAGQPAAVVAANAWTIQIGAFADVASAKAELQAYAARSTDILGQAQRIVAPFVGIDGQTLYRARFGPFPEKQARAVCQLLTERGQTCFAATDH